MTEPTKMPVFEPDDPIVVIDGLSKGREGTVVERWHNHGNIPAYRVDLGGLERNRIIRADYLRKREVPPC